MYIRVKENPSGTSSVMLIKSERRPGKKHAHSVMIKNFGTTSDQDELDKLKQTAERYKANLEKSNPKNNILRVNDSKDIDSCKVVHRGFHDIYGPIFDKIAKNLALSPARMRLLRDLAVLRIARPASKYKTASIAANYGCDFNVDRVYKLMDKMDDSLITDIKASIKNNTTSLLKANKEKLDVVFYDLTTIYFETNTKDDLRQFGFSKDGKSQHVQITLALVVTKSGLPIGYELFPGNMYEGHTLEVIMSKLTGLYNINKVVVVADSGLLNKDNIAILNKFGYEYIIAARIKSMNAELTSKLIDKSDYKKLNEDMSVKTIKHTDDQSLIACYSKTKARKDEHELEEKLRKLISKTGGSSKQLLASKFRQPYIKLDTKSKIIIDEQEIAKVKHFHGIFALTTNIKDPNPMDIITQYKGLWQIEQSFRIMKSEISVRPIFHWSLSRIKAHFALCYISFAMCRFLQYKLRRSNLNYSTEAISEALHTIKTTYIRSRSQLFAVNQTPGEEATSIYKAARKALPKAFYSL